MTDAKLVLAALKRAVKADYATWRRAAAKYEKVYGALLGAAGVEAPVPVETLRKFERIGDAAEEAAEAFKQDIRAFHAVCAEAGIDPEKAGLHPMYLTKEAK